MAGSIAWGPYAAIVVMIGLCIVVSKLIDRTRVRCPNCKKYNTYTVDREQVEDTEGWSQGRDLLGRRPAGSYRLATFDSTYTCTACGYVWMKREPLRL